MAILTEPKRVQDLILWEVNQMYTRISGTVKNDTGAEADFVIGQTLEFDTDHYDVADGTAWDAILLENIDNLADAGSVTGVALLVRGPAIINTDQLVYDGSATAANQVAAMETAGIHFVSEPVNVTEG